MKERCEEMANLCTKLITELERLSEVSVNEIIFMKPLCDDSITSFKKLVCWTTLVTLLILSHFFYESFCFKRKIDLESSRLLFENYLEPHSAGQTLSATIHLHPFLAIVENILLRLDKPRPVLTVPKRN